MKTFKEILMEVCQKRGLHNYHDYEVNDIIDELEEAAEYYAEQQVNEQREIMAKHLNLRNVPRPKL